MTVAAAALSSCSKSAPTDDRAMRILTREAAHPSAATAPRSPTAEDDRLERLAQRAQTAPQDHPLPLPVPNQTVYLGTVAVKLATLTESHAVSVGRMQLTSEDAFLQVKLMVQNVGTVAQAADFGAAHLEDEAHHPIGLARDVQHAAGTRVLHRNFGVDERTDLILYFEVPEPSTRGRTLVLPAAPGGTAADVRIALE